jgi:pyruvate ferredoxin oxidoreductase beta subunit
VAAHGVPYVATASVAYLKDLEKKIKKAMTYHGPRYIQIDSTCPSVWGFPSDRTLEVGRLAVECGITPLFEMENGEITKVRKIKKKISIEDYLKTQKRFRHLFAGDQGREALKEIQDLADANIRKYGLLKQEKAETTD